MAKVKALTVRQPYADFLVNGVKRYETRSWHTNYRGRVYIHSGKTLALSLTMPMGEYLRKLKRLQIEIVRGAIIGYCDLVSCIEIDKTLIATQSDQELDLGYWRVGSFAWKLENPKWIKPIPTRGKLGLWTLEYDEVNHG